MDAYVRAAAEHGMRVIDMHQDAYSAFIFTTDPDDCPTGTTPASGWDGLTGPRQTARPRLTNGERNSSPAVTRAWNNFYDTTTESARFAGRAAIADRFEGTTRGGRIRRAQRTGELEAGGRAGPDLQRLPGDVKVTAIRGAQADAPFQHLVFTPAPPGSRPESGHHRRPRPGRRRGVHRQPGGVNYPSRSRTDSPSRGSTRWSTGPPLGCRTGAASTASGTPSPRHSSRPAAVCRRGPAGLGRRLVAVAPVAATLTGALERGTVVPPDSEQTHLNRLGCPDNEDLGPTTRSSTSSDGHPRAAPGGSPNWWERPGQRFHGDHRCGGGARRRWTPTSRRQAATTR
ncbi:MAG: hypothetical protein R2705_09395 [Ilumatobacteraceae bacterium]